MNTDGVTEATDRSADGEPTATSNVFPQPLSIAASDRAASLNQVPSALWLTGLPGAGKSTIARGLDAELHRRGLHAYVLDADRVRRGLNRDLGFTDADRVENVRRVAEVARLMVDAGLIVICALISPFRADRRLARSLFEPGHFVEVFVDAPLAVAEARDPKGLYVRARRGEIRNFTGVDSLYEPPESPEVRLDTTVRGPEHSVSELIMRMEQLGLVPTDDPARSA